METKDIILELRTKKGMSQDELAEKVFVTRQAVLRWENGETTPNTETLKLLSKLFDVSINTLLGSPQKLICQCCGMPLEDSNTSREKDGFFNEERCKWCNLKNTAYIKYHDEEWGVPNFDERYLFEMLILESFQAGLSWECVLNKREAFRKAFDGFDAERVAAYNDEKIAELQNNKDIIRNKLKIRAAVNNAKIFLEIKKEYGSFREYLKGFTGEQQIIEVGKTTSPLSDALSADLEKRGMKFVGSTIIYSYLQAIGVIYSHEEECFMYKG